MVMYRGVLACGQNQDHSLLATKRLLWGGKTQFWLQNLQCVDAGFLLNTKFQLNLELRAFHNKDDHHNDNYYSNHVNIHTDQQ